MGDDGAGVKAIQRLAAGYSFPPGVRLLDGGTLGLDLLPFLEGLDRLLIIDAVETGGPPGTIARLTGEMIPVALETRLSPHQMGLRDLLAVSDLLGNRPPAMTLLGVQPETIEPGTDLSPPVESALDILVEMALRELRGWGIAALPL